MLFSIITVCYNSEKTISRTIESVLNQTCQDYEYIIVDGKSTDKTLDIIKEYETLFSNKLKYISEPDTGIYNAMNKGIGLCSGEIIGIVNSDDWLQPDALEIVKMHADKITEADFIISGWMNFHYTDGTIQLLTNSYERFKRITDRYGMGLRHPATFVSANVYQHIGRFDENLKIAADCDLILRCYKENVLINIIPQVLTNMADGGLSERKQIDKYIGEISYILKKHLHNKCEYFYLLCRAKIRIYSKSLVPQVIKMLYRDFK